MKGTIGDETTAWEKGPSGHCVLAGGETGHLPVQRDGRVGSFWFLHRRGVIQSDRRAIKFLSDIADRLQPIRNKVFAHIDKEVLRDPQKPYRDADLHWLSEIEPAIAKISELITRVYETRTGRPFPSAKAHHLGSGISPLTSEPKGCPT